MEAICSKCNEFKKIHSTKNILCKSCHSKLWRESHKEYYKNYLQQLGENSNKYSKKNYQKHKEKYKEKHKKYYEANKDHIKECNRIYKNKRLKVDLVFKIRYYIRNRLNMALKNNQKNGSAVKDLGCTIEELKVYLESKFVDGMSWENWTKEGWHIDHIRPLSSFDLTNREELIKACNYTNLQPLWAEDNLRKSDKVLTA